MLKVTIRKAFTSLFCLSLFFTVFAESASVSFVKGKAEVCRNDVWVQLKMGDIINPSEMISTGFQSELKIKYNNSVMAVGALTRITLDDLKSSGDKESVQLYLNTGSVRSRVSHTDNKKVAYTVKSPVAVASVRGTEFLMTGAGTVSCSEGAVAVYVNTDSKRAASDKSNRPAVQETEAEQEEASTNSLASTDTASKDYVPASATTPANEISESAPAGAVVVAKDQQVTVMKNGLIDRPDENAGKKKAKIVNIASTPLVSESVIMGSGTTTQTVQPTTTVTLPPTEPEKTELNITVKLSE